MLKTIKVQLGETEKCVFSFVLWINWINKINTTNAYY